MSRWISREDSHIVDAFRWTGGIDQTEDPLWMRLAVREGKARFVNDCTPNVLMIIMNESGTEVEALLGEWIVRDDRGEIHPCQPRFST